MSREGLKSYSHTFRDTSVGRERVMMGQGGGGGVARGTKKLLAHFCF